MPAAESTKTAISRLQTEQQQRSQAGRALDDIPCQLVTCRLDELRPHPSYVKRKLSIPACKIGALDRLGDRVFQDPIVVTQDRLIIDGYARWELAKKRRMATILCFVY